MRDTDPNNCANLNVVATGDGAALLDGPGDNPMRRRDIAVAGSARIHGDCMVALLGFSPSDLMGCREQPVVATSVMALLGRILCFRSRCVALPDGSHRADKGQLTTTTAKANCYMASSREN